MNALSTIGYLTLMLFNLYLMALMLRFLLDWRGASVDNPISQFLIKISEPLVNPLRRFVPKGQRFDYPLLTLWIIIDVIKWFILSIITAQVPGLFGILTLIFIDLINIILDVYFYIILAQVILSWANPAQGMALANVLGLLTAPVLNPIRRTIPPIGGFDLSPLFALIAIKAIEMLFVNPLLIL